MHTTHLIALSLAAALVACNPKETVKALTSDQNVTQEMAAPGEKVTVKGAVLGEEPVFAENIASFTIGDPAQLLANMQEHGTWTADSVPVEIRRDNTMTVQFVDEQGNPIKQSAKGVNGLKERDAVIITGTIDPHSTSERPVLNIESIVIEK